jgi:hypothetical protein
MAVFAGQNHRSAGLTDAVGAEAVLKKHSLFGDTVEVWRFIDFTAVTAKRLAVVVVGHNKYDVRPFPSSSQHFLDAHTAGQQGQRRRSAYRFQKLSSCLLFHIFLSPALFAAIVGNFSASVNIEGLFKTKKPPAANSFNCRGSRRGKLVPAEAGTQVSNPVSIAGLYDFQSGG